METTTRRSNKVPIKSGDSPKSTGKLVMIDPKWDLNLLAVAVALFEERSVTKAAKKLGMSQPGVSAALGRLRTMLDDQLFVKTATGIYPTGKAFAVIPVVRDVLHSIHDDVLTKSGFDPATHEGTLSFAMTETGEAVLLPRILWRIRQISPGTSVRSFRLSAAEIRKELENGRVDLALGYQAEMHVSDICQENIFTSRLVCLLRADHRMRGSTLSERKYLELEHIDVVSESILASERIARRNKRGLKIVLTVPGYIAVPEAVASSDLAATIPVGLAMYFLKNMSNLKIMKISTGLHSFPVPQYWHRQFDDDARIMWLRNVVKRLFSREPSTWHDGLDGETAHLDGPAKNEAFAKG